MVPAGEPEVIVLSISRSTTGRLPWIGSILPRVCWTANVLYTTLKDVERDQADGTEDRRAAARDDTRRKTQAVGGRSHLAVETA